MRMKGVMLKFLFILIVSTQCWGCGMKKEGMTITKEKEAAEILDDDTVLDFTVLDLGNHKVAYIVKDRFLDDVSGYELHIAIEDLELKKELYIPYDSYLIRKLEIVDDSFIEIECLNDGEPETKRWKIPHGFFEDRASYFDYDSLLLTSKEVDEMVVNEKVLEKEIRVNGNRHTLIWERVSHSYCNYNSIYEEKLADYRLTLINKKGEAVCCQIVSGYPVKYEEVCWIQDVSGDGNEEIIFCTYWENYELTELIFLEWSDEKKEFNISSLNKILRRPQWNVKQQALMFWIDSPYQYMDDMKMYKMQGGEWEIYAELLTEISEVIPRRLDEEIYEEIFYKELDTHKREVFYQDGKIIQNEIVETSWFDETSIWYRDNPDNLKLFPITGWEYIPVVLSTGEKVHKYVATE